MNTSGRHLNVAKVLRREILRSKAGQRLESISSLARRFVVSETTVKHALLLLAQEGLIEIKHGSGTYVADFAASTHVALWLSCDPTVGSLNYPSSIRLGRMHSALGRQGIHVKTYWTWSAVVPGAAPDPGQKEFLSDLEQGRIRAVGIVQGPFGKGAADLIQEQGIPVVQGAAMPADELVPGSYLVLTDAAEMVAKGVGHLLGLGCRKIAFLAWASTSTAPELERFRNALADHGVSLRKEWIRTDLHPSLPGAGYEEFREIWTASADKPDGLLIRDDVLVPDVVTAIAEFHIAVPEQLKVVAHANRGNVTCPHFPAARMESDVTGEADAMAEMLVRVARGESVPERRVTVPSRWVDEVRVSPPSWPVRRGREAGD